MFEMLALWEATSLLLLGLTYIDVPNPSKATTQMVGGIVSFCTLAIIAWKARSQVIAALWFGLASSIVLLAFSISCMTGFIEVAGLDSKEVRMPVFSFFTIAAAFV